MTIQKESQKTKQAMATRREKHEQWATHATKVEEHFSQVAKQIMIANNIMANSGWRGAMPMPTGQADTVAYMNNKS
ncbi:hypothetical protein B1757_07465 [Acidithiobacillus marinus]|uniref:Uncharacterized protein n=1 Tax=Acidithiobacillus marinus TaxID=187490 RepID=A0A2I1DLP4_9PROT|nr:hypothetical protein [Acidithiobacillus marinus]PKY10789.1 hypothetical protein B1757_07465 [Acidithiobacillus marinus]